MKFLAVMCLMAAGVSAQYGESGMITPDGKLIQFTPEQASNIAEIGPSGVVMHDGSHFQMSYDFAALHGGLPAAPKPVLEQHGGFGPSGIIHPDGVNTQFTPEEADNVVLIGPSGVVMGDGNNVQLTDEGVPSRKRRTVSQTGPSGVFFKDFAYKRFLPVGVSVAVAGPIGAVLTNGDNVQYDRKKRDAPVFGESGMITPKGEQIQYDYGVSVLLHGPSGALLSDGRQIQY